MNSDRTVIGIILVVVGFGAGAYGLFTTCSNSALGQAVLNVPSCQTTGSAAVLGAVLFIVGLVLIVDTRRSETRLVLLTPLPPPPMSGPPVMFSPMPPGPPPPPLPPTMAVEAIRPCPACGAPNRREWNFCQKCSKPLPAVP